MKHLQEAYEVEKKAKEELERLADIKNQFLYLDFFCDYVNICKKINVNATALNDYFVNVFNLAEKTIIKIWQIQS